MTAENTATSRASRIVTAALIAAAIVLAVVFRDRLAAWFSGREMHPAESSDVTEVHSVNKKAPTASATRDTIDHYTCPMHPSVNQPGPGKCPLCGMDLTPVAKQQQTIDHYTCPMHPSVNQPGPGKCPLCGMDLTPVATQQTDDVVIVDESRRQLIGVRSAPVIEAPMSRTFRTVGRVTYDESGFTDVNLKISGWIAKLLVNQTGQRVARGQTLFTLYSPELYNAQQDYLLATRSARAAAPAEQTNPSSADALGRAARKRLSLLGLSDAQIDELASEGARLDTIPVTSPASGFVIEKDVVEGAAVQAGTRLFRIAALDKVWIEAEVFEEDLAHVRAGQRAKISLDHLPGRTYDAKVAYVYPYLESAARTGRVRVELANQARDLRPGMYATVELAADIGSRVQVPTSAVVYTGPRRLVFVDRGEGRFTPREIRVGTEAQGMYEVLEGLKPGDMVVTSGTFLIAAEARISTAAKYWDHAEPAPAHEPTEKAP